MKQYINADSLLTPIFVERERREQRMEAIQEHIHNFYEMYFLVDGTIDKFIESRTYHLNPFDFVIIPPNRLHRSILCSDYRHERVVVYFDKRSVSDEKMLSRLDDLQGVITLSNETSRRVFKLLNILLQEQDNDDDYHNSYVSSVLTEMLVIILRSKCDKSDSYAGVRFETIIDYVKMNCREKILLSGVSKMFFMSEAHLSRMFRKNTGFTFTQYVNYQRIIYAQKRLCNRSTPISEIAMSSGFDNLTHFGRVFKQLTGCTPTQYRKKAREFVW